ncbi:MAG: phosphoglycerate kinase [Candidatus Pacebacteria bacterium]|nr:phosphoglycerate kinase [Candidatus Paceibacterota bacterium]
MNLKALKPQDVKNKKIIVRVDYNVPVKDGVIQDTRRIDISLETINFLLKHESKQIILMSHLGRPKTADKYEDTIKQNKELSLKVVIPVLEKEIKQTVEFYQSTEIGEEKIILLENLRFWEGEKKDDKHLAKNLAKLADIYINDAFSTSHRAHASVSAISHLLPAYAGFSLRHEIEMLSKLTKDPQKPFVMIIGGAKISDKVSAIENLAKIADTVLVGGGVANNFLKAEGFNIAKSYLQDVPADMKKQGQNFVEFANKLLDENQQEHTLLDNFIPLPKIIYPIDVIAGNSMDDEKGKEVNLLDCIEGSCYTNDDMFLDIGPRTIKLFSKVIENAKTIFWNGPMGVFETKTFSRGTKKIAHAVALSSGESILGGGDTISAIKKFKFDNEDFTYISTSGGASLEFLSGKELPGLTNLVEK